MSEICVFREEAVQQDCSEVKKCTSFIISVLDNCSEFAFGLVVTDAVINLSGMILPF